MKGPFFYLLHYQHILWQSLNWLYQVVLQRQKSVMFFQFRLIDKIGKRLAVFHETIHLVRAGSILMEVFEINFKEMNLFFNMLKDHFIVTVVFCSFKDSCEKKLIQMSYLVNIQENCIRLVERDNFFIEQRCPKV